MQVTDSKTNETYHRRGKGRPTTPRPPVWRPQASSLTRAELRQIVLDTLG